MDGNELKEQLKMLEKKVGELYRLYSTMFTEDSELWAEIAEEEEKHYRYLEEYFDPSEFNFEEKDLNEVVFAVNMVQRLIDEYSSNTPDTQIAYENAFKIESFAFEYHINKEIERKKNTPNHADKVFLEMKNEDSKHICKVLDLLKKFYLKQSNSFDNLFKIALSEEKLAKQLYLEFSVRFFELKEVSEFFESMAKQEQGHFEFLERLRASIDKEKLQEQIDIKKAYDSYISLMEILYSDAPLAISVKTALDLSHALENSEINTIFRLIVEKYVGAEERKELLYKQITLHNQKLIEFSNKAREDNYYN